MVISQKKTCKRCIAYKNVPRQGTLPTICALDFPIRNVAADGHGFTVEGIPLEPCPKPLTNSDYFEANKWYRWHQVSRCKKPGQLLPDGGWR